MYSYNHNIYFLQKQLPKRSRLEKHIEERNNEAASDEFEFTTVLPPPEKSPDLFSSSESEDHSMTPPPARCSPPPVSPRHAINSPPLHIYQFPQQFVTPYSAYPVSPRHAMPLESLPPPLPPPRSYQPIQKQFVTPLRYSAHPVSPRHAMPLESSPPPLPPPRSYQPIQKQFVTPISVNPRVPMEPIHSIYGPHLTEPSHQMVCSYNE